MARVHALPLPQPLSRRQRRILRALATHPLVAEYRNAATVGMSAAELFYFMADQMSKSTAEMVWWAALGLTDQLLAEHITAQTYNDRADTLRVEVRARQHTRARSGSGADETARLTCAWKRCAAGEQVLARRRRHGSGGNGRDDQVHPQRVSRAGRPCWHSHGRGV